jgi:hypothetical protein
MVKNQKKLLHILWMAATDSIEQKPWLRSWRAVLVAIVRMKFYNEACDKITYILGAT